MCGTLWWLYISCTGECWLGVIGISPMVNWCRSERKIYYREIKLRKNLKIEKKKYIVREMSKLKVLNIISN